MLVIPFSSDNFYFLNFSSRAFFQSAVNKSFSLVKSVPLTVDKRSFVGALSDGGNGGIKSAKVVIVA